MKNNYKKSQQGGTSKLTSNIPKLEQGMMSALQVHSPLIILISTLGIISITLRWLWGLIAIGGAVFSIFLWLSIKLDGELTNNHGFASNPDLPSGMEGLIYLFPAFMFGYAPTSLLEIISEDNDASSGSVIVKVIIVAIFYGMLLIATTKYYGFFIKSNKKVKVLAARCAAVIAGGMMGLTAHSMIGSDYYDAFYFSRGDGQSSKCYIKEVPI